MAPKLFSRACDTQARGSESGVGKAWVVKKMERHMLRQVSEADTFQQLARQELRHRCQRVEGGGQQTKTGAGMWRTGNPDQAASDFYG